MSLLAKPTVTMTNVKEQSALFPITRDNIQARLLRLFTQLVADVGTVRAAIANAPWTATERGADIDGRTYTELFAAAAAVNTDILSTINALVGRFAAARDYTESITHFNTIRAYYLANNVRNSILKLIKLGDRMAGAVNLKHFAESVEYGIYMTMVLIGFDRKNFNSEIEYVKLADHDVAGAGNAAAGQPLVNTSGGAEIEDKHSKLTLNYIKNAKHYNTLLFNLIKLGIPDATVLNYQNPSSTLALNKSLIHNSNQDGGQLSYVKNNEIHYLSFPNNIMKLFDKNYEYRFNTTVIRNLFFITNLNRVLRLLFEKTLTHSRNVIKHGLEFTNPSLTEYGQFPMFPNETFDSKQNNNLSRYSRGDKPQDFHNAAI